MSSAEPTPRRIFAAAALVVLAAAAAWSNSLHAPFVFDDIQSIVENPSIRRLWPIRGVLAPPQLGGLTISGRPLLNLSLALNYALGGLDPFGYHLFNLGAHILAGLALFGVMRRTLVLMRFRWLRTPAAAINAALFATLLWTLHPLQTESVTYVIQRGEVLMGLFLLLTLYCFIRSLESNRPMAWQTAAVVACLLGTGCKELIAVAPILVLLYDLAFASRSLRVALGRRRWFYAALFATWVPLGLLVLSTGGDRGGTFMFTPAAVRDYWLTQFGAICRYLKLSFWPDPLVFDYGYFTVSRLADVALPSVLVLALLAGTILAWRRWPALGFLGTWFFLILAPTSLLPGIVQMVVEHRMYLPVAAPVALVVAGILQLWSHRGTWVLAGLAVLAGTLTFRRNHDYRTDLALWSDTVAKAAGNPTARAYLGDVYAREGRWPEAIAEYRAALQLRPGYSGAHNNLGIALLHERRTDEALVHFEEALRTKPDDYFIHRNLGVIRLERGELAAAINHFEQALRSGAARQLLSADAAGTHRSLADALMKSGRMEESAAHWTEALRLQPDDAQAHYNLGQVLIAEGRPADAVPHLEAANRLQPGHPEIEVGLGVALVHAGRVAEGIPRFESALRTTPRFAEAERQLGLALVIAGRLEEALPHFERLAALLPDDDEAKNLVAEIRRALDPGASATAVGPK